MAIDDPVGIIIQQAKDDIGEESYLPSRLAKYGISAAAALALTQWPLISYILTTLSANTSSRFEKRFLIVAEELNEQQRRIEDKIPDKRYYESEEFQTLFTLLLERLHSTHQTEKLRMFGDALANSGSKEFKEDDREQFVRILRDLSTDDILLLRKAQSSSVNPNILRQFGVPGEFRRSLNYEEREMPSLARLVGLGLVNESHRLREFKIDSISSARTPQEADRLVRGIKSKFENYVKTASLVSYQISDFGERFLKFVTETNAPENSG